MLRDIIYVTIITKSVVTFLGVIHAKISSQFMKEIANLECLKI